MAGIEDLVVNLLASVIAGAAVWSSGRIRRRRRAMKRRRFFGLGPGDACVLVVPRHAASPSPDSVHQGDVAAMLEVATIARDCGARVELRVQGQDPLFDSTQGAAAEFCLGGPDANARTGAHLQTFLPGLTIDSFVDVGTALHIRVGGDRFTRSPGHREYVVLAKIRTDTRPVFVLCGQTAITNRAAARYLLRDRARLVARYGLDGPFCVVLEVVEPSVYGDQVVREVRDVTRSAFGETDPSEAGHTTRPPAQPRSGADC